jgi:hypothetical protein
MRIVSVFFLAMTAFGSSIQTNNTLLNQILNSGTPDVFAECTATNGDCSVYTSIPSLSENLYANNHSQTLDIGINGDVITNPIIFNLVPDSQCTLSSNSITINVGSNSSGGLYGNTIVTAVDDLAIEGPHNCIITATVANGGGLINLTSGNTYLLTVPINDDDQPIAEDPTSLIHTINSVSSKFFPVSFPFPVGTDVSIILDPISAADCTLTVNSIVFQASSNAFDYDYTVTAINDGITEPVEPCYVRFVDNTYGNGIFDRDSYSTLDFSVPASSSSSSISSSSSVPQLAPTGSARATFLPALISVFVLSILSALQIYRFAYMQQNKVLIKVQL